MVHPKLHEISPRLYEEEEMSKDPIIIVGAGPSGLVLALCLARYEIHVRYLRKDFYDAPNY